MELCLIARADLFDILLLSSSVFTQQTACDWRFFPPVSRPPTIRAHPLRPPPNGTELSRRAKRAEHGRLDALVRQAF